MSTPVLKFKTISKRKTPSDMLLKAIHEGLMSSLKKAMATGRTNIFTINRDRIVRSQYSLKNKTERNILH